MPTTLLTYASTVSSTWSGDISKIAADDGNMAGATAVGQIAIIALTNLPADVYSINSINYVLVDTRMNSPGKTDETRLIVTLQDSSGDFYDENADIRTRTFDITGTTRTTSDGSTAWTLSQLNDLRLKFDVASANPNIGSGITIDYAYVEVDYNEAPAPTYDKNVNNIHITSGNVYLKSGNVYI